jgi:amino acid transporter
MYKIIGADGKEYGPIAAEQLRQWIIEGRANGQTKVLAEGATEWKALREIPELATMLPGGPSTQPSPAPGPISLPQAPATISYAPVSGQSTTNPLAVTGMVLGIVSMVFSCCCYGLPWNLGGIICSSIALSQLKNNPNQQGRGMAIAGLILSIVATILAVVLAILVGTTQILQQLQKNL